ncbi:MAG: hypothetical protein U0R21_08435 [Nocardioidaceae bacterium]
MNELKMTPVSLSISVMGPMVVALGDGLAVRLWKHCAGSLGNCCDRDRS